MSNKVPKVSEIDFKDLKFSTVKKNALRPFASVFHNKNKLQIQLPKLKLPFGINKNQSNQLVCDLSLGDNTELIDQLKGLDAQMIEHAFENKNTWFKNEVSKESITESYFPFVKMSKDGNYPPTVRVKLIFYDQKQTFDIYDNVKGDNGEYPLISMENEQYVQERIKARSLLRCLVECSGLWISNNQVTGGMSWGLTWKLVQAKYYPPPPPEPVEIEKEQECLFISSGSESESELEEDSR